MRCELVDRLHGAGHCKQLKYKSGARHQREEQRKTSANTKLQNHNFRLPKTKLILSFNLKPYTRVVQYVSKHKHSPNTQPGLVAVVVGFEGSLARQTQVLGLFI